MLRLAGELADGVHVHPLNTPAYLRDTVQPALEEGAARSARSLDDFEMIVPAFLAVGDTDAEQHQLRELARMQIAFYGSTPNYAFIFEQIGFDGTTQRLREHAGDLDAMTSVITDDVLDHFVITATWGNVAAAIIDRYAGVATRVVNYFGASAWSDDPQTLTRWGHVARELAHE
jgi:alkanesulfonate monooxygenase SsuD/methylene tetrahydromethanopterin reductase-like flavin-dependent oxidoreductase (luciferase family)